MNKLLLKSPAKINLDLTILNKLKNGYHEINTSFQLIDLFDEIEFESSKNNISLSSNLKELNSDDNIITTVARKLKNSNSKLGVKIKLKKLIPIGAGLGGGSSNAASTIVALNKLWDLKMSKSEMHNFARNIGADVPFFLFGQNAQGNGIGDILKYKDSITDNILIIDPMIFSSTEEMYREYDLINNKNKIIKDNPNNNDFLDIFLEKNKGIIFLTPHHGCWELSGLYAASKIDTAILFNPFKNQTLNNYVLKGRAVTGATVVPTDNAGIKVLLKFLKNNKAIGILPDHTPKAGQGQMSFFFNEPSNTITLINKLARKSKVPILFIHSKRLPKGIGYEVFVEKISDKYYECSDDDALLILNKSLEKIILKYPEQYLWSYEKFRNRVGVEENIYVTTSSKTQELK